MKMTDEFRKAVLRSAPRALGLCDRKANSQTYGCFDRGYWHYKLKDTPNPRYQEAALFLGLLYKNNFEGNIYYKNRKVLGWCVAATNFLSKIQNRDGSFNEVYPFERSFCASSFALMAATENILLLNEKFHETPKFVRKSASWLSKNNNPEVSNQMAAACAALHNCYLITRNRAYYDASMKKLNFLLSSFKKKGIFEEYGGFDLGYTTITLSCLNKISGRIDDLSVKKTIEGAVKHSVAHIDSMISPDGSYDCKKSSRKTQFVYPSGLAGSGVINKICRGLSLNSVVSPLWMDDRYFIQLAADYLSTYLGLSK